MRDIFVKLLLPVAVLLIVLGIVFFWPAKPEYKLLRNLPVYNTEIVKFPAHQSKKIAAAHFPFQPSEEEITIIKLCLEAWQNNGLIVDSTAMMAINAADRSEKLFAFFCKNYQNNANIWQQCIPSTAKDSNRIDNTYFWHYLDEERPAFFIYQANGIVCISRSLRHLERTYATNKNKATYWQGLLSQQNIPSYEHPFEVFLGPYYDANDLLLDKLTHFKLSLNDDLISLEGNTADQALHKTGQRIEMDRLVRIIPDRIELLDITHKKVAATNASQLSFWKTNTLPLLSGEMAYAEEKKGQVRYAVFEVNDTEKMRNAIAVLSEQQGLLYKEVYRSYNIRQLRVEQIINTFWPEAYPEIRNPFLFLMDEYLVACNELEYSRLWIDYFIAQKNILSAPGFFDYWILADREISRLLLWRFSHTPAFNPVSDHWYERFWEKGSKGMITWSADSPAGKFQGLLNYESEQFTSTAIDWKQLVGQKIIAGPFLAREEGEQPIILIQTADNLLHSFTLNGKKKWYSKMGAVINGKPVQASWEGKWCIAVADRNFLSILDKEGLLLARWSLEEEISAVEAVNFGELTDPHFIISTSQNDIFIYNRLKAPLLPFNPLAGVESPGRVAHWVTKDQDLFIWKNTEERIQIYNRLGQLEQETTYPVLEFKVTEDNSRLYAVFKNGAVGYWDQNLVYSRLFNVQSPEGVAWWARSGQLQLVTANTQQLSWLSEQQQAFELPPVEAVGPMSLQPFKNKWYLSLLDKGKNQIRVWNNAGEVVGQGPFPAHQGRLVVHHGQLFLLTIFDEALTLYRLM